MPNDACRLFLITPMIEEANAFLPTLEQAMNSGADIACVLIRYKAADEGDAKKLIKTLSPTVQNAGAACLIEEDGRLALRTDVDGAHVEAGSTTMEEALAQLKPNRIVGAGHLTSRDDAMVAGEAGVDYLMFGGPDAAESPESVLERVAWWADIFNVPCVGYANSFEEAGHLARAGADFVAVCDALWADPRGVEASLKDLLQALSEARVTA
jgi:thiamine-phosphate pyrophosphorylase